MAIIIGNIPYLIVTQCLVAQLLLNPTPWDIDHFIDRLSYNNSKQMKEKGLMRRNQMNQQITQRGDRNNIVGQDWYDIDM